MVKFEKVNWKRVFWEVIEFYGVSEARRGCAVEAMSCLK